MENTPISLGRKCGRKDYPVWADGSHDVIECDQPEGHEGLCSGHLEGYKGPWRFDGEPTVAEDPVDGAHTGGHRERAAE